jgi:hypothetical protein
MTHLTVAQRYTISSMLGKGFSAKNQQVSRTGHINFADILFLRDQHGFGLNAVTTSFYFTICHTY